MLTANLQLAVIMISILRHRPLLALGNIVGSAISNILGAFSLGLLFCQRRDGLAFTQSSKVYVAVLCTVTLPVASGLLLDSSASREPAGAALICAFIVYLISIAWMISTGSVQAPEESDSDDDGDEDARASEPGISEHPADERSTLLGSVQPRRSSSLVYHIAMLFVGFASMTVSAFVLSHSAATILDQLGVSEMLFGMIVLSLATTLPEKIVAVASGLRGQPEIMVANTVGSNIFLLTLCLGIVWLAGAESNDIAAVSGFEVGFLLGSTALIALSVFIGLAWARPICILMLGLYVAFIILEFILR